MTPQFDARATEALLDWTPLADAVVQVLADRLAGKAEAPERMHLPMAGGGTLLVMPAMGGDTAITKLVSVHPANPSQGLPTIQGEVVVMDAASGKRLAILDGPAVTARRTAAVSLAAARLLAPRPGGDLVVLGSGVQAAAHVQAFARELDVDRIIISSPNGSNAQRLAAMAGERGRDAHAPAWNSPELRKALARAAFLVTATSSMDPILDDREDVIGEGCFVAAVGAFKAAMAEIPPRLVHRCRCYCDTLDGVAAEGGDLIRAGVDMRDVVPLEQVLRGPGPDSGPVLFKSVGHALFDLAAARLARAGLGV